MSDPTYSGVPARRASSSSLSRPQSANLGDILERVLDRGIVIAGDIRVNLLDIELLTIKLRLIIASVDTAREMGIDWWEHDPWLSGDRRRLVEENRSLKRRLAVLEDRHPTLEGRAEPGERIEVDRWSEEDRHTGRPRRDADFHAREADEDDYDE
ncbi:gas vesicle protein [Sinosporangium siamense]|uniref:Gas vesicle structural protein n=1 Tax=Sinosporangium siamense TaxID=1367973 RepID=A0A919RFC9_9ACTN|nr:gas vesicle protein [Sinosporangium siamense]GII92871.1 hypothetical protein Ssi02_31020 [Sinosporangium siamense]